MAQMAEWRLPMRSHLEKKNIFLIFLVTDIIVEYENVFWPN